MHDTVEQYFQNFLPPPGHKRVRAIRCRGGNKKFRALRLEVGNFAWGSENCTRKVRLMDVVYNCTNNELVRTKALVKNAIIQVRFMFWKGEVVGLESLWVCVREGLSQGGRAGAMWWEGRAMG